MNSCNGALLDDVVADEDGSLHGLESAEQSLPDPHADLPVYLTIHRCVFMRDC